jgi:hypothetical protein
MRARGNDRQAIRCVCLEAKLGVMQSDFDVTKAAHPELNDEQMKAFQHIALYRMSAYLAGAAGCGKTHVAKCAIEFMNKENANVKIAAPTACAAERASSESITGLTLHILFRIKNVKRGWNDSSVKFVTENEVVGEQDEAGPIVTGEFPTACISVSVVNQLRNVDCFVVDEVSMCDTDFIELMHQALCTVHDINKVAFGGAQVVFMGDFAQLSPIQKHTRPDGKIFAFQHDVFNSLPVLVLKRVMRQKDAQFSAVLSRMRDGTVTMDDCQWVRRKASNRSRLSELAIFSSNAKCELRNQAFYVLNKNEETMICPHKYSYVEHPKTKLRRCVHTRQNTKFPKTYDALFLKQGARVVCTDNIYDGSAVPTFRNGQFGTIDSIEEGNVWVRFDGTHEAVLMPTCSRRLTQTFKVDSCKVVAVCVFIPLKLAWACTIHKMQGASISGEVDIDPWCFAGSPSDSGWKIQEGAAYTAMSRPTSVDNIRLLGNSLLPKLFKCHPLVHHYHQSIFGR